MPTVSRLSLLVFLLLSAVAAACPVCGRSLDGQDNQQAYIWMTVMMCLVPVSAIGAVVLWLKLSVKASEAAERAAAADGGLPKSP